MILSAIIKFINHFLDSWKYLVWIMIAGVYTEYQERIRRIWFHYFSDKVWRYCVVKIICFGNLRLQLLCQSCLYIFNSSIPSLEDVRMLIIFFIYHISYVFHNVIVFNYNAIGFFEFFIISTALNCFITIIFYNYLIKLNILLIFELFLLLFFLLFNYFMIILLHSKIIQTLIW